jgi:iron(III) transport system substrate-binding protein
MKRCIHRQPRTEIPAQPKGFSSNGRWAKRAKQFLIGLMASGPICAAAEPAQVVNVYTSRHYEVDEKIHKAFEEQTKIKINQLFVKNAAQLIERLKLEGKRSPADVLVLTDVGNLHAAAAAGLFQPYTAATPPAVPQAQPRGNQPTPTEAITDPTHNWTALSMRARILVYHTDRVQPSELSTYEDLALPKWKGRLLVRSSQNIYNQSLTAALLTTLGPDRALKWATGIAANLARKPEGGDTDQIKAVGAGQGDLAVVNSYYYARMAASTDASDQAITSKVKAFFPNQSEGESGTHINISGAGLTRHAPNPVAARQFIDYLLSEPVQRLYAQENFEYPVRPGVEPAPSVTALGSPRFDTTPLSQIAEQNAAAAKILDKSGWH